MFLPIIWGSAAIFLAGPDFPARPAASEPAAGCRCGGMPLPCRGRSPLFSHLRRGAVFSVCPRMSPRFVFGMGLYSRAVFERRIRRADTFPYRSPWPTAYAQDGLLPMVPSIAIPGSIPRPRIVPAMRGRLCRKGRVPGAAVFGAHSSPGPSAWGRRRLSMRAFAAP